MRDGAAYGVRYLPLLILETWIEMAPVIAPVIAPNGGTEPSSCAADESSGVS